MFQKFIGIPIFFTVLIPVFAFSQEATNQFKMLESNLITGLIPDIEDGYGVAFRDFNEDDYPDIYLVCFRNLNRLLINNGGIIPFIDRTIYSGLGGYLMPRGETNLELGASTADYDNDGKPDIFLAGWGKTHKLFHNLGNLVFEDATENLNLQGPVDANQGIWFDADNDGYLDLYLTDEHHGNRFFKNNKNGFFSEAIWTYSFIDSAISQGACAADFDGDGDMDLYIANWYATDYLLVNDGQGIFTKAELELPTLKEIYRSNSPAVADIDNDGDLDILVVTKEGYGFLYRNVTLGPNLFFVYDSTGSFHFEGEDAYGALLEDFNNDGWIDCFFSLFGENKLFLNDRRGGFLLNPDSDKREAKSTGSAAADLDLDGDLDIFVSNKNAFSRIYLNPTNDKNYLFITLTGVVSNRDAIGSKIFFYDSADSLQKLIGYREVSAHCGYLSSSETAIHFGTGNHQLINLKIIFPAGQEKYIYGLSPGGRYRFTEYNLVISKVLYTLNGIRYQVSRSEFWLNFVLLLIFLIIIWIHIHLGIYRYQWQAPGMATQLIIWFIVSLIIFLIFRETELPTILIALNSVSIFGALVVSGYSEYMRSLRAKRSSFRNNLHIFSEQMINFHENFELFEKLVTNITKHVDITKTILFMNHSNSLELFDKERKVIPDYYPLTKDELDVIQTKTVIDRERDHLLGRLFTEQNLNIILPVKRENALFGLIGLRMENKNSPLNQEDLQLLQTIANQTAIAIENNNYIEESAELIKKLTAAQIREEYLKQLEKTNQELDRKNAELTRLFKELQEKEAQLIHSEKMASLGQLVAGISHELNNPISFIYANSQSFMDYLVEIENLWNQLNSDEKEKRNMDFEKIINDMKSIVIDNINGSRSVKELVLNLKNFSRLDQAEWKEARLVSGIESCLKMLRSQLSEDIKIVKEFQADPLLFCNPGQLNQVFINLISNAIQAIDGEGTIVIRTFEQDERLIVEVEDNGVGIPEAMLPKIFDPFFTTKDLDKGTGLGLTISYSIIQKHQGELKVKSEVGKGSVFAVLLPLQASLSD